MNRFNLLHGPSISLMAVLLAVSLDTSAQEPDLTYQGQLRQAGEAFTGTANLEFRLFDQLASGSQIGPPLSYPNWPINGGLFQVELDFGSSAFEGGDRYLEILVNDAPLQPRQWVTATPYALFAAGVAAGSIGSVEIDSSQVQQRITGGCPAGQSIRAIDQSGGVTCEADDLGPVGWNLNGNAGTNPATDFIGTTDAIPFEIRAADARSLRIEPSSDLSQGLPVTVNIIAGSRANLVSAGVRGATIGGGGLPENSTVDFPNGAPNQVTQDFGTIGGGFANQAGIFATVGGGRVNSASGRSFIGGGESNSAINESVVGGGTNNEASGIASVVAGGTGNEASGLQSTVGGGGGNTASGGRATVAGGCRMRPSAPKALLEVAFAMLPAAHRARFLEALTTRLTVIRASWLAVRPIAPTATGVRSAEARVIVPVETTPGQAEEEPRFGQAATGQGADSVHRDPGMQTVMRGRLFGRTASHKILGLSESRNGFPARCRLI